MATKDYIAEARRYEADVREVGTVEAPSAQTAIDAAREWPKFRYASGLARWPIVGPEWDA